MARQSPNRPEADEPDEELTEVSATEARADAAEVVGALTDMGSAPPDPDGALTDADDALTDAEGGLWDEVRIAPVEIALPAGVAYTLRAYRLSTAVTPTEVQASDEDDPFEARARANADEDDEDEVVILDEEFAALVEEGDTRDRTTATDGKSADDPDAADVPDAAEEEDAGEDVPLFLSHRGRLLAFKSPEGLVSFIRSGVPHDMTQLDTWTTLAERVQASDIVPLEDDSYELDLVVENLRGGHDTWDLDLLINGGEVARDLGYALRVKPVILALSAGSPLDDLDEALRAAAGGGIRALMGRRRLRKIGAQQASLGWRTIIGKISAVVDWRD